MWNVGFSLIILAVAFFVFVAVDEKRERYSSDEDN
jgi:hypothetical protein